MKFNYWITLISETYMFLAVCSGLNLFFYCRWDSIGDSVNSVMAIVCSSLILLMPFFVLTWFSYPKNYIKVLKHDKDFLMRYGSAIKGLNFKRHGRQVLYY